MSNIFKLLIFGTVFAIFTVVPAWSEPDYPDELIQITYAPFSDLLDKYLIEKVSGEGGLVTAFDYRKALANPETKRLISEQNQRLKDFDIGDLNSRELSLAFWTNAYNYFIIAHILENPLKGTLVGSVRDYGSLFNPYRVFKQKNFDVGGRKYSLDEIEKDILLGDDFKSRGWKEARMHFVVNCASVGCPPLRKQIYIPGNVDTMMSENTRMSLNTSMHLRLEGDNLLITRLFDWYAGDFIDEEGSVKAFIKKYADPEVGAKVDSAKRIEFIEYDWSLNKPDNFSG